MLAPVDSMLAGCCRLFCHGCQFSSRIRFAPGCGLIVYGVTLIQRAIEGMRPLSTRNRK